MQFTAIATMIAASTAVVLKFGWGTCVLVSVALLSLMLVATRNKSPMVLWISPALILLLPAVPFVAFAPAAWLAILLAISQSRRLTTAGIPRHIKLLVSLLLLIVVLGAVLGHSNISAAVMIVSMFSIPCLLFTSIIHDVDSFNAATKSVVIAITIGALLSLTEWFTGSYLISDFEKYGFFHAPLRNGNIRIQGPFPHALVLAVILSFGIALAIGFVFSGHKWVLVPLAVMIVALYLSQSRGPALGAIIGYAVSVGISKGRIGRRSFGFALLAVFFVILTPLSGAVAGTWASLTTPTLTNEAAGSLPYRLAVQSAMLDLVKNEPLGVGLSNLQSRDIFVQTSDGRSINAARSVDNTYLLTFVELGWAGGALMLGILVSVAVWTTRSARRFRHSPLYGRVLALLAGANVGFLFTSYTVATIGTWVQVAATYWLLFGLSVSAVRLASEESRESHFHSHSGISTKVAVGVGEIKQLPGT